MLNACDGLSPISMNDLGPHFHGNVYLVIEHRSSGIDARQTVVKILVNINRRELGNAMPNVVSISDVFRGITVV